MSSDGDAVGGASRQKLKEVYLAGASLAAAGRAVGVCATTAGKVLRAMGVQIRPRGRVAQPPDDLTRRMQAMYEAGGVSLAEVGEAFGKDQATVANRLRAAGVPIRPRGGGSHRRRTGQ